MRHTQTGGRDIRKRDVSMRQVVHEYDTNTDWWNRNRQEDSDHGTEGL